MFFYRASLWNYWGLSIVLIQILVNKMGLRCSFVIFSYIVISQFTEGWWFDGVTTIVVIHDFLMVCCWFTEYIWWCCCCWSRERGAWRWWDCGVTFLQKICLSVIWQLIFEVVRGRGAYFDFTWIEVQWLMFENPLEAIFIDVIIVLLILFINYYMMNSRLFKKKKIVVAV